MASFCWPVRVYYEDTDSGGVVYYANYLKFMERARTEWLRSFGCGQQELRDHHQRLFVVRALNIDYHRPARLDDALQVTVELIALRPASLGFAHQVVNTADHVLCRAQVRVACVDSRTLRPSALPDALVREFAHGD